MKALPLLLYPDSTGYSVRNLKYMAKLADTYSDLEIVQQVVAQIPWGHNVVLLDKVAKEDMLERYIENAFEKSPNGSKAEEPLKLVEKD